jgi:hypothetical protein
MKKILPLKKQLNEFIILKNISTFKYILFTNKALTLKKNVSITCTKKILKNNYLLPFFEKNVIRFPFYLILFKEYNLIITEIKKNTSVLFFKCNRKIIKIKKFNSFYFLEHYNKNSFLNLNILTF